MDIMRWSKLDNDSYDQACIARLSKQGTHIPHLVDKIFRAPQATDVDITWQHSADGSDPEDRFYLYHTHEAQDAGFEVGWKEKHRLFPYPQTVLDNNPALHQNPGW